MDCSICYDLYDKEKSPYIGNCGHSFCLECWEKSAYMNLYRCPLCKKSMLKSTILKNYLAAEIIETNDVIKLDSLIEKYQECNENFLNKLKKVKDIDNEIKELKEKKKELVDIYKKESQGIIIRANIKANIIIKNSKKIAFSILKETKNVVSNINKIYEDISNEKILLENSIDKIHKKINEVTTE